MAIPKRIIIMFSVLVSCVGCDQMTKAVAQSFIAETEVWSFMGDSVRFQLAYSPGAFLSLGSAWPDAWRTGLFSVGVSMMLLGLLGFILFAKSVSRLELLALTLLLAGGLGNLIDRVLFGYVIDFINIGIGSVRTGVFNVADIAVSLGMLLLVASSLISRKVS